MAKYPLTNNEIDILINCLGREWCDRELSRDTMARYDGVRYDQTGNITGEHDHKHMMKQNVLDLWDNT